MLPPGLHSPPGENALLGMHMLPDGVHSIGKTQCNVSHHPQQELLDLTDIEVNPADGVSWPERLRGIGEKILNYSIAPEAIDLRCRATGSASSPKSSQPDNRTVVRKPIQLGTPGFFGKPDLHFLCEAIHKAHEDRRLDKKRSPGKTTADEYGRYQPPTRWTKDPPCWLDVWVGTDFDQELFLEELKQHEVHGCIPSVCGRRCCVRCATVHLNFQVYQKDADPIPFATSERTPLPKVQIAAMQAAATTAASGATVALGRPSGAQDGFLPSCKPAIEKANMKQQQIPHFVPKKTKAETRAVAGGSSQKERLSPLPVSKAQNGAVIVTQHLAGPAAISNAEDGPRQAKVRTTVPTPSVAKDESPKQCKQQVRAPTQSPPCKPFPKLPPQLPPPRELMPDASKEPPPPWEPMPPLAMPPSSKQELQGPHPPVVEPASSLPAKVAPQRMVQPSPSQELQGLQPPVVEPASLLPAQVAPQRMVQPSPTQELQDLQPPVVEPAAVLRAQVSSQRTLQAPIASAAPIETVATLLATAVSLSQGGNLDGEMRSRWMQMVDAVTDLAKSARGHLQNEQDRENLQRDQPECLEHLHPNQPQVPEWTTPLPPLVVQATRACTIDDRPPLNTPPGPPSSCQALPSSARGALTGMAGMSASQPADARMQQCSLVGHTPSTSEQPSINRAPRGDAEAPPPPPKPIGKQCVPPPPPPPKNPIEILPRSQSPLYAHCHARVYRGLEAFALNSGSIDGGLKNLQHLERIVVLSSSALGIIDNGLVHVARRNAPGDVGWLGVDDVVTDPCCSRTFEVVVSRRDVDARITLLHDVARRLGGDVFDEIRLRDFALKLDDSWTFDDLLRRLHRAEFRGKVGIWQPGDVRQPHHCEFRGKVGLWQPGDSVNKIRNSKKT